MSGQARQELLKRLLDLRPQLQRRFNEEVDRSLHEELENVTIRQLHVMQCLEHGPLSMGELAHRLGVSESSATSAVDRLVKAGLAERASDASDRRLVLVGLSTEGTRVVARVQKAARQRIGQILAVLSDAQVAALVQIYEAVVRGPSKSNRARSTR